MEYLIRILTGEVIVGLLGLIGVLMTIRSRRRVEDERDGAIEQAKALRLEVHAQAYFLSFGAYIHDWQSIEAEAMQIIHETEVDRILLFQAWNGENDPNRTTAVCQFRAEGQELVSYRMVELDWDYQDRLRRMKHDGPLLFTVRAIADCMIKRVYDAEGVRSSVWMHISSLLVPGTRSAAMSYASYSTHTAETISEVTQTRCKLLNDRLSAMAANYESGNLVA